MKQLGNLAIICAQRADVLMQICGSRVSVNVGEEPDRETICLEWNDDTAILNLIKELNFGTYAPGSTKKGQAGRMNCPLWREKRRLEQYESWS